MNTQTNTKSKIWWLGLIVVIIQGLCGIATAIGLISPTVAGTITALFAAVLAYCNGNNPSLKDVYSIKEQPEE